MRRKTAKRALPLRGEAKHSFIGFIFIVEKRLSKGNLFLLCKIFFVPLPSLANKEMQKVLIITYYWAPAGGPGVQRWLKFAKYLRHFGIEPVIYAPENPFYPITDPEIDKDLPEDITVVKQPIWEPYRLASLFSKKKTQSISAGMIPRKRVSLLEKLMLWVRGNLFIPDARKYWVKPSVKFLKRYIKENDIQTIITTSPPHSVHLIGYHLKRQCPELKWIADFRDPWTSIGYYKDLRLTRWADRQHHYWEREVLQKADAVIATSFTTGKDFQVLTDTPIYVITNGYDERPTQEVAPVEKFRVAHIGSLLSDRNPKLLWQAFAELIAEDRAFADDFELCLAGKISEDILADLTAAGLSEYVVNKGYLPHQEAIALQDSAQVLLLIEIDAPETRAIIAGKLFEYMASGRPIWAVGPESWDVTRILEETHTGVLMPYNDLNRMKKTVREAYENYKKGTIQRGDTDLSKYSREKLTGQLANVINRLTKF